ncbi:hypothetical protein SCHPADRAFT_871926 [Schizopora paradoxa]|uniref:Non-specific serine/threonine protein kinase n=1 Tax=Schizopora paradoxa TaxID=27342 RepID=A0A0H2RZD1_9AGAM|nr:hypothetical protein SCHPADRAFT_871926 [Schizopora paradoxa]
MNFASTLADVADFPGVDDLALNLVEALQNISVYRHQADELANRCTQLLLAYREACEGLEDTTHFTAAADEITTVVEKANEKAQIWAKMGRVKSLVNQSKIKEGIESLYRDVETCAHKFNIATSAGLRRTNRDMELIRVKDDVENKELLQKMLQDVETLKEIISNPNVGNVAHTIEKELDQPLGRAERDNLHQGLLEIYQETNVSPPGTDLTGQVEKLSIRPEVSGSENDIFIGVWLGKTRVALKLYRALGRTRKARKRFEHEVGLWRELQHPNICRLYGIAVFNDAVYSVSSWMENGDVLSYVKSSIQEINRLGMLVDVASGVEYLHSRKLAHGDIRAANILIDEDGRACISGFGFSKVLEDVESDERSPVSDRVHNSVRWHAPELIRQGNEWPALISPTTDVWSYGMLCLEIMTGNQPYAHRSRDNDVIADLLSNRLPPRPAESIIRSRGLTDDIWEVMLSCWRPDPLKRPDMKTIRYILQSTMAGIIPAGGSITNSLVPADERSLPLLLDPSVQDTRITLTEHFPESNSTESVESWLNFDSLSDLDRGLTLKIPARSCSRRRLSDPPPDVLEASRDISDGLHSSSLPNSIGAKLFGTRNASSSSSLLPTQSALLNHDDLDVRVKVRRDVQGRLVRGTLAALVDELLVRSQGSIEYRAYQETFLTNVCLINPKDEPLRVIIRLLLRHHVLAESKSSEERVTIRYKILDFLKSMLMERHENAIDTSILKDLLVFLEGIVSPPSFADAARDLKFSTEALIRRREHSNIRSLISNSDGKPLPTPSFEPKGFALGMMVIEGNVFKRITSTDCVLHLSGHGQLTSVSESMVLNERIVMWVKRAILRPDRISDRGDTLRFFINTASECQRLGNLSSMVAILKAINSTDITGLKKSREHLKRETKVLRNLEKLSMVLDPAHDYKTYKDLLLDTKHRCIPWLTVHLEDLNNYLKEHEAEVVEDGHRLVNFQRYRSLSEKISKMLVYQDKLRGLLVASELSPGPELKDYLERRIMSTPMDSKAKAALEARSLELCTLEAENSHRRIDELRNVGFG